MHESKLKELSKKVNFLNVNLKNLKKKANHIQERKKFRLHQTSLKQHSVTNE